MDINMQYLRLCQKLKGHYSYYGLTGNFLCLKIVWESSKKLWKKWLGRRSRNNRMNWDIFNRLLKRFPLPKPRVVHSIYAAKL